MLTLGITTSTDVVGVALGADGEVVSSKSLTTDRRHAEELMPMIIAVLADGNAQMSDLELLAVDVGPGRFTGLRVGLTTVRTLALALGLEVVSATSLELLAYGCSHSDVAAVVDARRGEVFQQHFVAGRPSDAPAVGDPGTLSAQLPIGAVAVGDGADRYSEHYRNRIDQMSPSAEVLIATVQDREARPGPQVIPLYMRAPDVQINIKTRDKT